MDWFSRSPKHVYNVKKWGAEGDGRTIDVVAIQRAINAVRGSTLYFPAGTYIVKAGAAETEAILHLAKTGLIIRGDGPGVSTIKIANACPTYQWLLGPDTAGTDLTGLEIRDLTFDHNIANNPITNSAEAIAWPEFTCGTRKGSDIYIHDVEIKNASSCNNIFCAEYPEIGPNILIKNITASGIGDDPNHVAHDASFIYVAASDYEVSGCDLSCDSERLPGSECAIECHGTDYTVRDNAIDNFRIGANITGIGSMDAENLLVQNNDITGCLRGIDLISVKWLTHDTGYGINHCQVIDNAIDIIPYGDVTDVDRRSGIELVPGSDMDVNDLLIDNNDIALATYDSVPGGGVVSSLAIGYALGVATAPTLSNSIITNNRITNFPLCGMWWQCSFDTVSITGNTFTDCGSTLAAGVNDPYRTPIFVVADNLDTLDISNNIFIDNIPVTRIPYWFYVAATTSTGFTIQDNSFSITGDGVSLIKQIEVADNTAQPLITGTIESFVPPVGQVDTGSAIIDTGGSKYTVSANDIYAPKNWTLQGSSNGADWTTLDTQVGIVYTGYEVKTFNFTGANYRYYKLDITLNNGGSQLMVNELLIFHSGDTWTTPDGTTWLVGVPVDMTANNAPPPNVASASTEVPTYEAWNAFDKTAGNLWIASAAIGWLKIDLGA